MKSLLILFLLTLLPSFVYSDVPKVKDSEIFCYQQSYSGQSTTLIALVFKNNEVNKLIVKNTDWLNHLILTPKTITKFNLRTKYLSFRFLVGKKEKYIIYLNRENLDLNFTIMYPDIVQVKFRNCEIVDDAINQLIEYEIELIKRYSEKNKI